MLSERKAFSIRVQFIAIFTLSCSLLSNGFLIRRTHYNNFLTHAVDEEIEAAAFGEGSNDNVIMSAAAAITKESCQLLGVKSLGVDYGLVRTGIAATVGYDPKPLKIMSDLNNTELSQHVVALCRSEQANQVIVGLPLHKNGTEANQTTITRVFAAELAEHVIRDLGPSVPVLLFDERYTSKEAAARAHSRDPNRNLQGQLDADAACIILESYYNDNGHGAEVVKVEPTLYEECAKLWEEKRIQEEKRLQEEMMDRDARVAWRREAIERDRILEQNADANSKRKKKKRKKKKK